MKQKDKIEGKKRRLGRRRRGRERERERGRRRRRGKGEEEEGEEEGEVHANAKHPFKNSKLCILTFHSSTISVLGLAQARPNYIHSKISNSRPSEKRTTSLQRTSFVPPIDIPIELVLKKPPRGGHLPTPDNGHWPWRAPD